VGLYASRSAEARPAGRLRTRQLVYGLTGVIHFVKREGSARNAKWLCGGRVWISSLETSPPRTCSSSPGSHWDDLGAKTRRCPRRLLVHAASVAPDDVSTEGRLPSVASFIYRLLYRLPISLFFFFFLFSFVWPYHLANKSKPAPTHPFPHLNLLSSAHLSSFLSQPPPPRLTRCLSHSSHKPRGHSCSSSMSPTDLPLKRWRTAVPCTHTHTHISQMQRSGGSLQ